MSAHANSLTPERKSRSQSLGIVTVNDVTRPLDQLPVVEPETPVAEALKSMAREDVNQLPSSRTDRCWVS